VRGNEIDGDRRPGRVVDAELEESATCVVARNAVFEKSAWITLHFDLPSDQVAVTANDFSLTQVSGSRL
jgi:hypothetical protein